MICFDMDGTIADLYAVDNWLAKLRAEDETPYAEAAPMWDMTALAEVQGANERIVGVAGLLGDDCHAILVFAAACHQVYLLKTANVQSKVYNVICKNGKIVADIVSVVNIITANSELHSCNPFFLRYAVFDQRAIKKCAKRSAITSAPASLGCKPSGT